MAFAICRVGKISSAAKAGKADAHNERTYEVKNADPERRHLNGEFIDQTGRPTWELANERIEEMGIKPKADAVRVVEFMLSASPDFFEPGQDIRASAYFEANLKFMQERYGANLLKFTLHQDESTPHFQAMIVPITDVAKTVTLKNGEEHTRTGHRLTAAELFNPKTLRQLQTDYAQAMAPFGLSRGMEKSPARHQDIKRVYGLNRAVQELDPLIRQSETIKTEVVELSQEAEKLQQQNQQLRQIAEDSQRALVLLQNQNKGLEEKATALGQELTQKRLELAQTQRTRDDLLKNGQSLLKQVDALKEAKKGLEGDVVTLTEDNTKLSKLNDDQRQNLDYLQKLANRARVAAGQTEKVIEKPKLPELNNSPKLSR